MLKQSVLMGLTLSCCLSGSGQEFEAASIRSAPTMIDTSKGSVFFGSRGGPGTESPVRYWCSLCDVSDLIVKAYDITRFQLVSTKRLPTGRFGVVATIASGTTQDQFRLMLQNLLVERFGLKVHHERREIRAYRLLVSRGGAKLKPYVEGAPVEAMSVGKNAPPGFYYRKSVTLVDFAKVLENSLDGPVVDATGLTGKYDFDLSWSFNDLDVDEKPSSDLPTLRSAIESLGLKIDSHKESIDVIVVDDIAKSPTAN